MWNVGHGERDRPRASPRKCRRCSSPTASCRCSARSRCSAGCSRSRTTRPGGPETVILTAGYWRSKFGGDPSAIGRTLMLDSRPREIIGVLPDSFRFLDRKLVAHPPVPARSQQGVPRSVQLHRRWRG